MSRTTATFSVSLPPEMAAELELIRKDEHRTRFELVREALRRYFRSRDKLPVM
ncbi:ribbon-helix-helix protein, CopG family [Candidatus Kaiserbacteria bacterium]|nr:ribbon-helix-helix protein, CopG family [Candidatus Kaiserbacteria bacterium]